MFEGHRALVRASQEWDGNNGLGMEHNSWAGAHRMLGILLPMLISWRLVSVGVTGTGANAARNTATVGGAPARVTALVEYRHSSLSPPVWHQDHRQRNAEGIVRPFRMWRRNRAFVVRTTGTEKEQANRTGQTVSLTPTFNTTENMNSHRHLQSGSPQQK